MTSVDEMRYIQAYSRIMGVKEDEVTNYAQRKGIISLVDNASQLLTTQTQREKHKAFLDLYRMSSTIKNKNPQITSPETAASFFHSVMEKIYDQETVAVAFLNTKNRVIDHAVVSLGTINSSIVHPREVFRNAILNKAKAIIVCHNHPSGDLTPSPEDQTLTQRLKEIGTLIGISVIDHVIINGVTRDEVYSFKQNGVLEAPSEYHTDSGVSDERTSYRVHGDGIREVPENFIQPGYLRNVEDSIEQNDNQFEGVINNIQPDPGQREPVHNEKPIHIENERSENDEQQNKRKSLKQQLNKTGAKSEKRKSTLLKSNEIER